MRHSREVAAQFNCFSFALPYIYIYCFANIIMITTKKIGGGGGELQLGGISPPSVSIPGVVSLSYWAC